VTANLFAYLAFGGTAIAGLVIIFVAGMLLERERRRAARERFREKFFEELSSTKASDWKDPGP
jgi:hypothetical protein